MKRKFSVQSMDQLEIEGLDKGQRNVTQAANSGGSTTNHVPRVISVAEKLVRDDFDPVTSIRGEVDRSSVRAVQSLCTDSALPQVTNDIWMQESQAVGGNARTSETRPSNSVKETLRNVKFERAPTKLKDLLKTRLLDNLRVRYIRGHKGQKSQTMIYGVINGTKIRCSCNECKGTKDVTPNEFEYHAKSKNKRPADYIYLDNNKSLRFVLQKCTGAPLNSLASKILDVIYEKNDTNFSPSNCIDVGEGRSMQTNSSPEIEHQVNLLKGSFRRHKPDLAQNVHSDGTALSHATHEESGQSQIEAYASTASHGKLYMSISSSSEACPPHLSIKQAKSNVHSFESCHDLYSMCSDEHGGVLQSETFPQKLLPVGRVPGIDPATEITEGYNSTVEAHDDGDTACAICSHQDYSRSGFNDRTAIICDQCEKEYHVGCLRERKIEDMKALPKGKWFCCQQCHNIHCALHKLIEDGGKQLPEAAINILRKKLESQGSHHCVDPDIKWRLLIGESTSIDSSKETQALLSDVISTFHEQFGCINDATNTSIDLIESMVLRKKVDGKDFSGMYCMVLIVKSKVVCAGVIRIFGEDVAELPLVATKNDFQGKGYFQALLFCIQNLLSSLNVKDLVLPAAASAAPMWRKRFGFEKLSKKQLCHYERKFQLKFFGGTSFLHKLISRS